MNSCSCPACETPNTQGRLLIATIHAAEDEVRNDPSYRAGVRAIGRGHRLKPSNRPTTGRQHA